jgi:hypothetical protein
MSGDEGFVFPEVEEFFNKHHVVLLEGYYDMESSYENRLNIFKKTHPVIVLGTEIKG